jgi:hypothetical protein
VGVITDYFAADDRGLSKMDFTMSPVAFDSPSGVSAKGIDDKVMLGQLESVITGASFETIRERVGPPPIFIGGDEGPWVVPISDVFTNGIAGLQDERLDTVARDWLTIGDFYCDDDEQFVVEFVRDMRTLARQAIASGQRLCCWMSL